MRKRFRVVRTWTLATPWWAQPMTTAAMHCAETYYDCAGACLNDADDDDVCDELGERLHEFGWCNFNPVATDDDGSCTYAPAYRDCGGACLNDADDDLVCDEEEVPGCTDVDACNTMVGATDDDGNCTYALTYYDCAGDCQTTRTTTCLRRA